MDLSVTATPHGLQPDTRGVNAFDDDASLRAVLGLYLDPADLEVLTPAFQRLGGLVHGRLDALAHEADRNPPVLRPRDRQGRDVQAIDKHPAYVEMERIGFQDFSLAAMSHRPALGLDRPMPPAAKYAFQYLFAEAEFGLLCPISMTDALTRTIRRYADPDLVARCLPGLTAQSLETQIQGAMFMTEKAAGSDVGATETVARRDGEGWRLWGDKWFCSNTDAGLALVLARPEGAPAGIKGVSLFLLPRDLPDGRRNAYRIVRLKDKLGTRSMASGEITLEGAAAWMVGEPGQGFVQMAEMINQSRLSNAVRSAGMMRRALREALAVARGRSAFGSRLIDLPLQRRQLLKLMLPAEQALSVTLFTADALARADAGEAEGLKLRRILTPLVKFRVCRDARKVAGDGMEARGGVGYIEEWPEPRLVRDAHLGSIWEGTSNIVALDVLRAARKEAAHAALGEALSRRMAEAGVADALRTRLDGLLRRAVAAVGAAAEAGADDRARSVASGLYHAASACLLASEGSLLGDEKRTALAELVIRHKLSPRDPLGEDGEAGVDQAAADLLLT
ncbi:acyl-CoA dehydrogenase family protein [Thalassobaculum salexigens]|uniref:acyl-CoA dehydrogenase family protein n=1 Tax=Thalassobaculum salexigens TaxID=455360 RepID=UPI000409284D|nr:acyl-CoA dehydrogenase family protein [Thalassobaculum salexigens]